MSPAHVQRRASGQVAAGTHTLCNEPRTGIMRRPQRAGISFLRVSSPRLAKRRREVPPRPGSVRKKRPSQKFVLLFYTHYPLNPLEDVKVRRQDCSRGAKGWRLDVGEFEWTTLIHLNLKARF